MKIALKRESGSALELDVLRNPEPEAVCGWLAAWLEFASASGVDRGVTDAWDWANKAITFAAPDGVTIALVGSQCEGLMSLSWPCGSRLETGSEALYLEYVEAAPWNRADLRLAKRITGLGTMLLYLAVNESRARGYGGRLALHSLVTAESFYRRSLMKTVGKESCGPDGELTRCEFDAPSADAFTQMVVGTSQ